METDAITPALIDKTLQKIKSMEKPPIELLNLDFLPKTKTQVEQFIYLYDCLRSITLENLSTYRRLEGLQDEYDEKSLTNESILVAFSRDFIRHNAKLEAWSVLYYRYLALPDFQLEELAIIAGCSRKHLYRRYVMGLALLTDIVRRMEIDAHLHIRQFYLSRHLPPPNYTQLFGMMPLLEQLDNLILDQGSYFISIEGLNGIGKTTLAQEAAYRLAKNGKFYDIIWVSGRQEIVSNSGEIRPADQAIQSSRDFLRKTLKLLGQEHLIDLDTQQQIEKLKLILSKADYVIILDHLEVLKDDQVFPSLLTPLAEIALFVFTSHHTLRHYPTVKTMIVPELSFTNSHALLDSELIRQGYEDGISSEAMVDLYNVIGGLPLALKLIAAQMRKIPLEQIINELSNLQFSAYPNFKSKYKAMYAYIHRQTWQLLDNHARQLLVSMFSLSPQGNNIQALHANGTLDAEHLESALDQLIDYCLVDVVGSASKPMYRLHRITATLLQAGINGGWISQ